MAGYTPLFDTVFSGSLCGQYPDTAAWVFLLALADKDGHVDKTPQYISAITGMPVEMLMECINRFMEPDPSSRSDAHDGRRLVLIDGKRSWGWKIVNHSVYREKARLAAREVERVQTGENKERMRKRTFKKVGREYSYGDWCRYCGCEATGVDHIQWDGPDTPENTVACCHRCNTSKNRRDLITFLNTCEWIDPEVVMKDELLQTMVTWKEGSFYPLLPPLPPYDPPSDSDSDTDLREDITVSSKPLSDSAEPNPTVNGKVNGAIVEAIFEHWKVTHDHPRAKLDKKRKALIRSALKNYEEAELCQAITGYLNSPHHMGQNDRNTVYDDISIMLRDSKHIDAGLKFYSDPPRTDLSKRGRANLQVVSEWQPPEIRNATK